jgi:hypothetical protein
MTALGAVQGQVRGEASPMIRGELGWVALLGTVLVWALIAIVAYFVIRLAVRHALQDVARDPGPSREPSRVDAG